MHELTGIFLEVNQMKKVLSVVLALAMIFSFAACGKKESETKGPGCFVTIVKGDGEFAVTREFVEFHDYNEDGKNDIDEVLKAAHATYGKEEDYATANTEWGLSLAKLWGDNGPSFGYYLNDQMAMSLADEVKESDYLVAYVYQDQVGWSDAYSYIEGTNYQDGEFTVHVMKIGFDENWNPVPQDAADVEVFVDGTSIGKTDAEGKVTSKVSAKDFTVTTKGEGLVPAVCKVALQ